MVNWLKVRVNLGFLVNPFYIFAAAFSLAIFVYLWGWSSIFPQLSAGLLSFLIFSALLFIFAGRKTAFTLFNQNRGNDFGYINEFFFSLIITLGTVNVFFMGYLPILSPLNDYRKFGVPVLDPVFNSLSIFFSAFFFHSFLKSKKKKFLLYVILILLFQILLFRRSTMVWILTSSSFLYLLQKQKIKLLILVTAIVCIPVLSYCFGLYGNKRSNLNESYVINDLGASESFKHSGISYNHYITYLYLSSPLANLQKNVDNGNGFLNNRDFKAFFFYSLLPQSFTLRLEKTLKLIPPECSLIIPDLIAGSFFLIGFFTLGWLGMALMLIYLFAIILLCLFLLKKCDTFSVSTYSILVTAVSLMIFSNFLNRLDVILMLFVYPPFFHLIYTGKIRNLLMRKVVK
jgi:hypothetical protein